MARTLVDRIGLAGIAAVLFGVGACTQEIAPPLNDGISVDKQGALHFESADIFFSTIEAVSQMTPVELDAWEERHGFTSFRHEFERVMHQAMNALTPQEADTIIGANDDLVELTDDGTAEPRIRAFGYSAIITRDGLFYVDGVIHKVTPDVVISADDGRLETLAAALTAMGKPHAAPLGTTTTPAEGVRIVHYGRGESEQNVVPYGCTDTKTAWFNTSDRKVDFNVWTWDYYCAGCCGTYFHQVIVQGQMKGYKKNWLGNWTDNYSTSYNYEGLEFQVTAPYVTGYGVGPNGQLVSVFNYQPYLLSPGAGASNGDWVTWSIGSWNVGHQVQNSPIAAPYFDKVKGRGKSRGTGENGWAEICCGYAGGCYFPPTCTPRTSCYVGECGYVSNNCGGTIYCGVCGGGGGGGGCPIPLAGQEGLVPPECAQ